MPAMLLLPLVRWASTPPPSSRSTRQRRDADLEVSVRSNSSASASSAEPNIAGVRERLARLFAGAASLDVSVSADARHARLLIPRPKTTFFRLHALVQSWWLSGEIVA